MRYKTAQMQNVLDTYRRKTTTMKLLTALAAFAIASTMANATPIDPSQIQVTDGDTISVGSERIRLVGFDTPETYRAQCSSERELGNKATFRLRQLIADGGLELEQISCSCPIGTEGTPRCNYGRSCGILRARGKDVGEILISEGLAHRYVCGKWSCPPRRPWC